MSRSHLNILNSTSPLTRLQYWTLNPTPYVWNTITLFWIFGYWFVFEGVHVGSTLFNYSNV